MTSSFTRISVALCTFNGADFLEDQLWSIDKQSVTPFELIVCDDGSADDTINILEKFKSKADFPVRIYQNREQIGVLKNFTKTIGLCEGDYIALCDQDDIWLPDKLAVSYEAMKRAESDRNKDIPLLVYSDLRVVSSEGAVISSSFMDQNKIKPPQKKPLRTLLVQNFVTGCTVLMNRALVEAALPIPEKVLMHDWWLALVAASLGKIIYIPDATVLYRQHSGNIIGSKAFFSLSNLLRLLDISSLELEIASLFKQGMALRDRLGERPDYCAPVYPVYLKSFLDAAQNNGIKTAFAAMRFNIKKNPWPRNLFFIMLLLKGGYLRYLRSCQDIFDE